MEQLFNQVTEWQSETFPNSTALSKATHLYEEVQELMIDLNELKRLRQSNLDFDDNVEDLIQKKETDAQKELADCFILLFGAANKMGLNFHQVQDAIQNKHIENLGRKWGKPDANGVVKHVKN